MDILKIKFLSNTSGELEVQEYEVDPSLKSKYGGF